MLSTKSWTMNKNVCICDFKTMCYWGTVKLCRCFVILGTCRRFSSRGLCDACTSSLRWFCNELRRPLCQEVRSLCDLRVPKWSPHPQVYQSCTDTFRVIPFTCPFLRVVSPRLMLSSENWASSTTLDYHFREICSLHCLSQHCCALLTGRVAIGWSTELVGTLTSAVEASRLDWTDWLVPS